MRITDFLRPESILLNGAPKNKMEAINILLSLMQKTGAITDMDSYKESVLAREQIGSTGMGEGVAIPHGRCDGISKVALAAMVVPDGVDFDSLDGEPAKLFFLIAAPNTKDNVHLDVLSHLSVLLTDSAFSQKLIKAKTMDAFFAAIDAAENAKDADEETMETSNSDYQILAVTACPTGIAHTYMAAEKLSETAQDMGIRIKVETNGSSGVKNALTAKDIANAECIIVAADKEVRMSRFDGKPVITAKVADGISKAKQLITKATSGEVPVYHHKGNSTQEESTQADSIGRKIYKSLMNGVSYMLPFVTGGGILIALAFLFDSANAGTEIFGNGNGISTLLKTIGGEAMGLMFPILAGFIAMAIADRPGLVLGIVGGFIAKSGLSYVGANEGWFGAVAENSSGFFGALIAGFLSGLVILALQKLFSRLPKALDSIKPILLYPVLGLFIMGGIMIFIVNPPMSVFNNWINSALTSMSSGSRVLLGILLGAMMSIDFGGPINKAAYVFGTSMLAGGISSDIMAAVMAGGMVPPLAIALSTLIFKNRYTSRERSTTVTNFIMGASFITEGAIPFAASDPLRVIPSCAIGSAVTGGLSMLFGCTSPAPHGGLFVVVTISNPLLYLVAIAAGAVVGMFLLGLLKKPIQKQEV